jgi:hypothetical protein
LHQTYGGTGNGFTKFSGPTTSEKTFTLPNATATILTTNAAVTIAQGGTGTTTAQGAMNTFAGAVTSGSYLRGNGTNVVMATIQAADVPTLNQNTTGSSGSCTGNAATATLATTATNVSGGTVNSTTLNVAGNGSSADPYGTAAVTEPANANNYSYYGLTRAGQIGAGFGLSGTTGAGGLGANAFWFGSATAGSAGVLSGSAWIAFNGSSSG